MVILEKARILLFCMETKFHIYASMLLISAFLAGSADAKERRVGAGNVDVIPELDCVIEPSEIVDVGSAVPGVVETVLANRSDMVKKGAVIARLDSSVEQASLRLAKERASLDAAIKLRKETEAFGRITQKRNQNLMKNSAISRHVMDQVETETRIAGLQVQQEKDNKRIAGLEYRRAQAVLQQRIIRSPVDGVIMERFKSAGEYVEDEPLLRVAQLDPLHVEVIVPVEYLGRVKPGMQAEVVSVIPGSDTHLATVERVDLVSDAASGTYGAQLKLSNPKFEIPSGLRCRLNFLPWDGKQPEDTAEGMNSEAPDAQLAKAIDQSGYCYTLGPVKDQSLAMQLSDLLEDASDDLTVREESLSITKGYFVFTLPEPNRQATDALVARLKGAGFNDLYISRRDNKQYRVSLGFFRNQQSAERLKKKLVAGEFQAEVVPVQGDTTHYWLDVSMKSGTDLPGQLKELDSSHLSSTAVTPVSCISLPANQ